MGEESQIHKDGRGDIPFILKKLNMMRGTSESKLCSVRQKEGNQVRVAAAVLSLNSREQRAGHQAGAYAVGLEDSSLFCSRSQALFLPLRLVG